jgi:hypothetical protein
MERSTPRRRDLLVLSLAVGTASAVRAGRDDDEDVGTSSSAITIAPQARATPPNTGRIQGEFVIHNPTNFEVGYSVRWGDGPWQGHKIAPRYMRRHWHVLDASGRAPHPQLRFDDKANDNRVTNKTYGMKFGRVGNSPSTGPVNKPIEYEFVANGQFIDLKQR